VRPEAVRAAIWTTTLEDAFAVIEAALARRSA
jgi:hypothetical protein